jgi:hypothetical protein
VGNNRYPTQRRPGEALEIIVNWSCSVDLKNLDPTDGPLTVPGAAELRELEEKFALYCGMGGGE